ncbi:hypothetical protein F7Q99_24390 [Streptomyces kaniharaensis]|uniref:MDMPI C-terminal domain-containing protein n=1 Tax=Streptomyces kaniharaensis TaxID=212423 RepID=A0A6N7KUX9_9ACTN|nr:hypothetical protein [Streptomyces kaniharaensis]MQS15320.1 hypothetical protein [Streptomyces kaniharaensis]
MTSAVTEVRNPSPRSEIRCPRTTPVEHSRPDLTLAGSARDLYLLLWNRLPAEHTGRIEHTGDETLLGLWRETATIRWS